MKLFSLYFCVMMSLVLSGCPAKTPDRDSSPDASKTPVVLTEKETVDLIRTLDPSAIKNPKSAAQQIDPAFMAAVLHVDKLTGKMNFDDKGNIIGVDLTTNRGEITDADLPPLVAFKDLKKIKIGGGRLTDKGMETVAQMPNIVDVFIQYAAITDKGIDALAPLKNLRSLGIRDTLGINDQGVKKIVANFPNLQTLRLIEQSSVTPEAMSDIRKLKNLRSLDMRGCEIGSENLAELVTLKNLKGLKIGAESAYLDDTAAQEVGKMKNLTSLAIEKSAITDDGVKLLVNLPLTELSLAHCSNIMDEGMNSIAKMKNLKKLSLVETFIGNDGIAPLASLLLVQLSVGKTALGDDALSDIIKIKTLRRLDMDETQVSNDGLEKFLELPELESLNLTYCGKINDEGIETLSKMKNLKNLNIAKTLISIQGAKKLQDALPGCTVTSKEGG